MGIVSRLTPNSQYGAAASMLGGLYGRSLARPWEGIVYRYVASTFADKARLMSGDGAFNAGGRWNAPKAFHAVYCSSNVDLAQREYFASSRKIGIPDYAKMPFAGLAIKLKPIPALNLCDVAILSKLGVTLAQFKADDWKYAADRGAESFCQAIGRAAKDAGFEALLVPAAEASTPDEFNVVLIVENCPPKRWKVLAQRQ